MSLNEPSCDRKLRRRSRRRSLACCGMLLLYGALFAMLLAMAGAVPCSDGCVAEFGNCVSYGPGQAVCESERTAGTGPLSSVCTTTCVMPPSPPPAAAGGPCSAACVAEFGNCVSYGPGQAVCESERTAGTGPLSAVCNAGCVMDDGCEEEEGGSVRSLRTLNQPLWMNRRQLAPCSTSCGAQFSACVSAMGQSFCDNELATGAAPMINAGCTVGCTMAPPAAPGAPCSASCVTEFSNCVRHGPGRVTCEQELAAGVAPLVPTFCVAGCAMPPASPPTPAGGPCSEGCTAEFATCVQVRAKSH